VEKERREMGSRPLTVISKSERLYNTLRRRMRMVFTWH